MKPTKTFRKRDRLRAILRRRRIKVPARAMMLATVPAIAVSGFAPAQPVGAAKIEQSEIVIRDVATPDAPLPDADLSVLADPMVETEAQPVAQRDELGTFPASFYGPGFEGRPTASGERFDPSQMTAAHRTLPFGTMVEVTNVATGQSVVVRINDRGPFHGNRAIDLSEGAAEKIGMKASGTANVRMAVLS